MKSWPSCREEERCTCRSASCSFRCCRWFLTVAAALAGGEARGAVDRRQGLRPGRGSGHRFSRAQGPGARRVVRRLRRTGRDRGRNDRHLAARPHARRPRGRQEPEVSRRIRATRRRRLLERQHVPELRNVAGAGLFRRGQSRRALRQAHQERREVSQGQSVDRSPRAGQVEPFLRRGGLRQAQAAGPVEYQLPGRRACARRAPGRTTRPCRKP